MAEVLLICRFVARTGMEFQLRALLQGMLAPTYKPNRHVNGMNFYESDSSGACICAKHGESQAALDQILRQTIANPIGPEFMAPPARNTVAAQEMQSPPRITWSCQLC